MVVELDVTQQCTDQVFGIAKAMRRQHGGNTAVETLHHAIGLRSLRQQDELFDAFKGFEAVSGARREMTPLLTIGTGDS